MSAGDSTRVAVDIGGTFTDVVLERGTRRLTAKILTTPEAPEAAVLAGVGEVLGQAGLRADDVDVLIHGTTLATNAIIERKGARTGLVTTEGFRDVLQIGYEDRYDQYDIDIERPVPLVPRERRLTVRERVAVDGRVVDPLDEDGVAALVPAIERLGIESLAIGFLHAYANPAHEARAAELLGAALPGLSLTLSSEACPEVREYERFTTAVANAYVRPLMERYLGRLQRGLVEMGLAGPLLVMTSGGGITTLDTAMRFPIRLVESGPAGGAILASVVARELALERVISFDMGGTTAKICLIEDFEPQGAREFEVDRAARFMKGSGLPLRIPVIEMVEIGAGGGSIARVDAMRSIAVGPDSAGADPGPAAYGRGAQAPTVTDADVVLGRIDPARFAAGKVTIDPALASSAIANRIGEPLGMADEVAAFGIAEMVDETMANAARVHAVERGEDAAAHSLVAFGGAAPLHVGRLAEKLAVSRIVVPADAGVGSAIGFLRAPVAYEVVRSRNMRLDAFDADVANEVLSAMRDEAMAVVTAGAPGVPTIERRGAYMRYFGQGHEILVPLPLRALGPDDRATLAAAYDREYEALFKRTLPNAEVEVLTWAVTVSAAVETPTRLPEPAPRAAPPPIETRTLVDSRTFEPMATPIYWRADLEPGIRLEGPAMIAEDQTSTFITPAFTATIASNASIVIERRPEERP